MPIVTRYVDGMIIKSYVAESDLETKARGMRRPRAPKQASSFSKHVGGALMGSMLGGVGAIAGGVAGSIIPGAGTAAGAALGGAAGGALGGLLGRKAASGFKSSYRNMKAPKIKAPKFR